jgi:hypothetical protein
MYIPIHSAYCELFTLLHTFHVSDSEQIHTRTAESDHVLRDSLSHYISENLASDELTDTAGKL